MNEWLLLGIGLLLTIGTGVFVAAEFALVTLDRADVEDRQARGETGLGPVVAALRRTSLQLSSAQLGITLTTLLTGFTMEPALSSLLRGAAGGWGISPEVLTPVATVVGMLVATFLSMLVGELIPKNFAIAAALGVAKLVVPLQLVFTWLFRPAVHLLNGSANALLRSFGVEPKEELSGARTAEELSSLVRRSALEGVLERDRAALLARALRFADHTAADVMTPRGRIQAVGVHEPVQRLLDLARETGHSRFPVTGDDIDEVLGVAHVKMAMALPRDRRALVPVGAIREDALFVPETVSLDTLLGDLRGGNYQFAVVLDEYGGTAGVTTLEDLVEEIVGELADEHDRRHAPVLQRGGRLVFDGMLRPDELLHQLNITIPDDGPYETVGGYLMWRLARIPMLGDEVHSGDGTFVVERMDGRRIDRVRFVPNDDYVSPARLEREYREQREGAAPGSPDASAGGAGRGGREPLAGANAASARTPDDREVTG